VFFIQNKLENYKISYSELPAGKHYFNFQIDDKFFSIFKESDIEKGEIFAEVEMIKSTKMLLLDIILKGYVNLQCDKCGDFFDFEIYLETKLKVDFGEVNSDLYDADDTITVSYNETDLTMDQHFYDYINLSIPIRKIHPKDINNKSTCNKESVKKLKELTHKDETISKTDPRWDALKSLLN